MNKPSITDSQQEISETATFDSFPVSVLYIKSTFRKTLSPET